MSGKGNNSNKFSKSGGARGRIQEVLAQARASLKEPSRPFTPSSLDERTSLDAGLVAGNGFFGTSDRSFESTVGTGGNNNNTRLKNNGNSLNSYGQQQLFSSGSSAIQGSTLVHRMLKENFKMQNTSNAGSQGRIAGDISSLQSPYYYDDEDIAATTTASYNSSADDILNTANKINADTSYESLDVREKGTEAAVGASSSSSSSSSTTSTTAAKKSSFKLFISDLKDLINTLDFASIEDVSVPSNQRIEAIIEALVTKMDKLSKAIRTANAQINTDGKTEIETVVGTLLTTVALRLVDRDMGTISHSTSKLHLLRCLLRFYLACLASQYAGVMQAPHPSAAASSASTVDYFTVLGLKRVAQGLYQLRCFEQQQQQLDSSTDADYKGSAGSIMNVRENEENYIQRQPSRRNSKNNALYDGNASTDQVEPARQQPLHSTGAMVGNSHNATSLGGSEVLIDLLSAIWRVFPNLIDNELVRIINYNKSATTSSSNSSSYNNNNNNNNYVDDEDGYSDYASTSTATTVAADASAVMLLECVAFAAAVLRSVSSTGDTDRRRLVHCAAVEVLAQGFSAIEKLPQLNKVLQILQSSSAAGGGLSGKSLDAPTRVACLTVADKVALLLVQLLGVIRNFALDNTGRKQLLAHEVVKRLCSIQRNYKRYPDVLLNCARVTAKLSLLDTFRAQINSKATHIKSLVDVVIGEAMQCDNIMEGNTGGAGAEVGGKGADGSDVEEPEWPSWHTWPLLSRICFTLGNLTTTNEGNRRLIGVDCKIIKPIVILLQACAGSLTQLRNIAAAREQRKMHVSSKAKQRASAQSRGSIRSTVAIVEGMQERRNISKSDFNLADNEDDDNDNSDGFVTDSADQNEQKQGIDGEDEEEEDGDEEEDEDEEEDDGAGELELRDATIKLLRLLANLSIDTDVGAALASRSESLAILLELIRYATDGGAETEEMLLNVIAACTNVSFYTGQFMKEYDALQQETQQQQSQQQSQQQQQQQLRLVRRMEKQLVALSTSLSFCLFHENNEIVLETARVLGNLTQHQAVRASLITNRTDEALVLLLGHVNADILSAVTGTLINMSADQQCKVALLKPTSHILAAFSDLLRRVSFKDILLSTLICQVLHNLLSNPLGSQQHRTLSAIADNDADYTDNTTTTTAAEAATAGAAAGGGGMQQHTIDATPTGQTRDGGILGEPALPVADCIKSSLIELSECAADLKVDEMDAYASFERVADAVITLLEVQDQYH